jgi:hypothetical protein
MNSRVCFFAGLFLLSAAAMLPGFGKKEKPVTIQVTGVVRLVGNGSFPELVISSENGEWYITKEDNKKLNDLQHRTVTVEGAETVIELKFASGLPAGVRRELKNITIIAVQ